MNWEGFEVVRSYNSDEVVGRIDGQTAWTGVNQAGDKTMSYQFAVVIKANSALSDIFNVNREQGKATQLGWWIPARGEDVPPERWQMNLVDVYLKSSVNASKLTMR